MLTTKPKSFVIVGGSLGGPLTGVALKSLHKNLDIRILERKPTSLLQGQGAGIVALEELQDFFKTHDRTRTGLVVRSSQRVYLDKKGNVSSREDRVQHMTSWDLLYHVLRANYDGFKSEYVKSSETETSGGTATYEQGCTVTDIKAPESLSNAGLDFSEPVQLTVKNEAGETSTIEADMVIAADDPSSTIRSKYLPDVKREYAGYVAWRGTVLEDEVSDAAKEIFVEKFPFFHAEHIQILAYTIPGKNGALEPGKRLLNWVWYVNYEQDSHAQIEAMTNKDGKRHYITLPAGGVREEIWKSQKEYANEVLPPQFAELVNKTEVPFIQAITDVIAPSALLAGGRVLLIGDALAGFRPHTAMSTGQAAKNAIKLAEAVEKVLNGAGMEELHRWEEHVVEFAKTIQAHGVAMGDRSQFSKDPRGE